MTGVVEGSSVQRGSLRAIGWRSWAFGVACASVVALLIAVPTRLVPNPWFTRMTPTRTEDYLFLAASSTLLAATLAVGRQRALSGARPITGGVATYLAVGGPVCNKIVVLLLGTGGALTWFAPLQPVIGLAGLAVLATALRSGLRSLDEPSCQLAPR